MKVNQVEKRVRVTQWQSVKFQILTYCFLRRHTISEADLDCLTLLAIQGPIELTKFCDKVYEKEIFQSSQTVRNAIAKAEKKNLIIKEGKSKKRIYISPDLNIQTQGNILLDYKFLCVHES